MRKTSPTVHPLHIGDGIYPLIIETRHGNKYGHVNFDLIRTPFDLTKAAGEKVTDIIEEYQKTHLEYRKCRTQWLPTGGGTFISITVLKADIPKVKRQILEVVSKPSNLVRIGIEG